MKRAKQIEIAEKVRVIHRRLGHLEPSLILPLMKSEDEYLIVQDWQEGSHSANFAHEKDRKESLKLLNTLHDTHKNCLAAGARFAHLFTAFKMANASYAF